MYIGKTQIDIGFAEVVTGMVRAGKTGRDAGIIAAGMSCEYL